MIKRGILAYIDDVLCTFRFHRRKKGGKWYLLMDDMHPRTPYWSQVKSDEAEVLMIEIYPEVKA